MLFLSFLVSSCKFVRPGEFGYPRSTRIEGATVSEVRGATMAKSRQFRLSIHELNLAYFHFDHLGSRAEFSHKGLTDGIRLLNGSRRPMRKLT